MTPKAAVRARHPDAWAVQSAQLGYRWVIMCHTTYEPMRLGLGNTPQQAWRSAANYVVNGVRCI